MSIEQRLETLERQNRRLKWTLIGLVGLAVTGCAMGLRPTHAEVRHARVLTADVVRAARVEVPDADGRPIVVLSQNRDATGGVVYVNNEWGALVAQMGAADDGRGVVWTYTAGGEPREDIR